MKTIMLNTGMAHMGIGCSNRENRAVEAAKQAIKAAAGDFHRGARSSAQYYRRTQPGAVRVNEAAELVSQSADPDTNIIFGAVIDEDLKDEIRITVIATGFSGDKQESD